VHSWSIVLHTCVCGMCAHVGGLYDNCACAEEVRAHGICYDPSHLYDRLFSATCDVDGVCKNTFTVCICFVCSIRCSVI